MNLKIVAVFKIDRFLKISLFGCVLLVGCSNGETNSSIIKEDGVVQNPDKGLWQDQEELPFSIELVETFDLSLIEEPIISSISYLTFDKDDNMYFLDRRLMKMISLDPEGNLRWAVGQEGKGPGDFENPFGMAIHNGKIYVANIQGTRIDEFGLNGNFIKTYDLPKEVNFASLVGIRENGQILLSGAKFGTIGADIKILQISDTLEAVTNFSIVETEDDEFERATSRGSISMEEDFFVYSFATSYGHRFYDYDSTFTTEVTREFEGTLGPGVYMSGNSISIYSLGSVGAPIFLDNGYYLMNVRYPTNITDPNEYARKASTGETESPIYEEVMDLYNSEHELLYVYENSEKIEGWGNLDARDSEGYFYSTFSNDLLIKKYKVAVKYQSAGEGAEQDPVSIE
ncbi:MAG TPA: hypothetical protein VFM80_04710 [Gracilimonas sp.]|uniref:hypothetical protein n=1 Tax=Gracilimonas sp. TaxID=1974203 RepID=UPI002DA5ABE8|nr:hypothetical protein [Gracilimonas sp.]